MTEAHAARTLLLLCGSLTRRLLREGMVVRSLVFPVALVTGTLLGALLLAASLREREVVALSPDVAEALEAHVLELGLVPLVRANPRAAILDGEAWAATDGETYWVSVGTKRAIALEAHLRRQAGATWLPVARVETSQTPATAAAGRRVVQVMALLFSLYGVVFGAGMVVRDRDDGTLEAELSLPVPAYVHGLARWLTASLGLSAFYALGLLVFHAVLEVPNVAALLRHGVAANATAAAVGLLAVAWTRQGSGFSTTLAGGLTAVTGLVGVGVALPEVAAWLPLASVASTGAGWAPLAVSAVVAVMAVASFSYRIAR